MVVHRARIGSGDLVLEPGPGDGIITRELARSARRVLAYELDGRLAERLRCRFADQPHVRCHHADFRRTKAPREPFAVVSNVPFSATTDIVRWCLEARSLTSATLVTQLEFARKHTGDFGRWTKLAVANWPLVELSMAGHIPRSRFDPVPRVDAGIMRLERRSAPLVPHRAMGEYRSLVEAGFSGVGGTLAASLTTVLPKRLVRRACSEAGIALDLPVGLVEADRWVRFFRALN
jgi:23S rRNA (adenine-N6)-dimethyltransferase